MDCPKCKTEMEPVNFGGVEVDRCKACQGIWFDAFEVTRLKEMRGSEAIDIGSAAVGQQKNKIDRIDCPRCHTPMIRMVDIDQHHIWFESCKVCKGLFLDAGEFRDLHSHTLIDYIKDLFAKAR